LQFAREWILPLLTSLEGVGVEKFLFPDRHYFLSPFRPERFSRRRRHIRGGGELKFLPTTADFTSVRVST